MAKHSTLLATVQSSSTGESYDIKRDDVTGATWCGCMGWRFSKDIPKSCKHVRAYLSDVQAHPNGTLTQDTPGPAYPPLPALPDAMMQKIQAALKPAPALKPKPVASLVDVLLDMASRLSKGDQYMNLAMVGKPLRVSEIVATMRQAAEALRAGAPLPAPAAAVAVTRAVRVILLD
jgi:hypothetical protein